MSESLSKTLLENEVIEKIDLIFAKTCLKNDLLSDTHLFLAYLFSAIRNGHHCISILEGKLRPDLVYDEDLMERITTAIENGSKDLPIDVVQKAGEPLSIKPIVQDGVFYYLQKSFFVEKTLVSFLQKNLLDSKALFETEEIIKSSSEYKDKLFSSQLEAIQKVLSNRIGFLTGGPGSGKTYTAAYLLKVFENLFSKSGRDPKIALAAPTGKAALRLKESLERAGVQKELQASTIHQLLSLKSKKDIFSPRYLLPFDFILIDEASMIDTALFMVLLKSIAPKTQLVFLGDPYQLPPVESGTVFAELSLKSKILPVAKLLSSVRMENEDLLNFSKAVLNKKTETFLQNLSSEYIHCETLGSYSKAFSRLDAFLENYLKIPFFKPLPETINHEEMLKALTDTKLLSPLNKGVWGVDTINELCFERQFAKAKKGSRYAVPIMLTKNDYEQGLFNGMEGVCIRHYDTEHVSSLDFAIFKQEGKIKTYNLSSLKAYQHSYCISVHKSQGSEYNHLTVFLPSGSEKFGTEMLYTAITRAKKNLNLMVYDFSFEKMHRVRHLKETNIHPIL